MTSRDHGAFECFVYLTPPGETRAVTAGRFVLDAGARGGPRGRFVYGRRYLARPDAVEVDPVELPLGTSTRETALLGGVFGALRDSGPDHWGRRLIERHAQAGLLSEVDYLLSSPDDRAGALGFGRGPEPPAPMRAYNRTLDLARLQAVADRLVADGGAEGPERVQVEELLLIGTSMGGARPKAVVEDADGLWLAKFGRADDRWNVPRVEHAMLLLGRACGLATADSRVETVAGRDVLLVRRFDRTRVEGGYTRSRMVSALTLLRAEEAARERWSYVALAEALRRVSGDPRRDAAELFRRMCFNALISNNDDHPRNHAVVAPGRGWRLSPAFDLVPSTPLSLERRDLAMTCGDLGRWANARNLLSQGARFLLAPDEAARTLDDMEAQVAGTWRSVARGCGVSERDCEHVSGAFDYPGFRT